LDPRHQAPRRGGALLAMGRAWLLSLCALLAGARPALGAPRTGPWHPGGNDCREFGAPRLDAFVIEGHRFTPRWIARALHGVIADHCGSKRYFDLMALDGGTV